MQLYSLPQALGPGPHGSLEDTKYGFFYLDKRSLLEGWVEAWGCGQGQDWHTGREGEQVTRKHRLKLCCTIILV